MKIGPVKVIDSLNSVALKGQWHMVFTLLILFLVGAEKVVASDEVGGSQQVIKNVRDLPEIFHENGCIACHGIDEQRVGPAFLWIKQRYGNQEEAVRLTLAKKIVSGGGGAWGYVPMIANPQITQKQAEQMMVWIINANYESK